MVVVASNPPGCLPVKTSGFKLARAVYKAAVQPAQPEPMMTTFSIEPRSFTRIARGNKDITRIAGLLRCLCEEIEQEAAEIAEKAGKRPFSVPEFLLSLCFLCWLL